MQKKKKSMDNFSNKYFKGSNKEIKGKRNTNHKNVQGVYTYNLGEECFKGSDKKIKKNIRRQSM